MMGVKKVGEEVLQDGEGVRGAGLGDRWEGDCGGKLCDMIWPGEPPRRLAGILDA